MDAEFTRSCKIVNMRPANRMHPQIFWLSDFEPDQTHQYFLLKHWNIKIYSHQICIDFLISLIYKVNIRLNICSMVSLVLSDKKESSYSYLTYTYLTFDFLWQQL